MLGSPTRPDWGYGLFSLAVRFLEALWLPSRLEWPLLTPLSLDDEPFLKLASFFTQVEKGRLRVERSGPSASRGLEVRSGRGRTGHLPAVWGVVSVMAICC